MSASTHSSRAAALEQAGYLVNILQSGAEFEQQVDAYLQGRRSLARYFRDFALEEMNDDVDLISIVKTDINNFLSSRLADRLPAKLFVVRGYTGVHTVLLRYLQRNDGNFVSADRLRVLTEDQVHTERRVRELRDLGFRIDAQKISGQNQYRLSDLSPDLLIGGRYQLRRNLESEGSHTEAKIALLVMELS